MGKNKITRFASGIFESEVKITVKDDVSGYPMWRNLTVKGFVNGKLIKTSHHPFTKQAIETVTKAVHDKVHEDRQKFNDELAKQHNNE